MAQSLGIISETNRKSEATVFLYRWIHVKSEPGFSDWLRYDDTLIFNNPNVDKVKVTMGNKV